MVRTAKHFYTCPQGCGYFSYSEARMRMHVRGHRYKPFNYSFSKEKPFQIVDSKTGKHYYYASERKRNVALHKFKRKIGAVS